MDLMKNLFTLLLLATTISSSLCQEIETILLDIKDTEELYLNDGDATTLHYLKITPPDQIKGVLVLIPAGYETTEEVLQQVSIHTEAVQEGLLVIVPSINWGTEDRKAEIEVLDYIFKQLVQQYQISKDRFILGGLSNGGMIALTYAEQAVQNTANTYLKPAGVFGLDTPLDKAHFYEYCEREIQRNFSKAGMDEARWIMNKYNEIYGGSPVQFPKKYIAASIYSNGEEYGGNAIYLKDMPIRMYSDLDLDFLINQRRRDLYDWNGTDIVAMINDLKLMGNQNANVIISRDKGVRLDGTKHPHAWSIMETSDCLDWMLKVLKN
ncbi:MAG: hypothetical protein ACI849_000298 [Patiriisocius sp.]|jgi:hypothetical protein